MKTTFRISRRERLYLLAGGVVLLVGLVLFPSIKAATAFREAELEVLFDEQALLADLNALVADADAVEREHDLLREALKGAGDLLFPPIENRIMTQTMMIRLLNEMGPDLELEVSAGRSSSGDSANQMNLSVRGRGRYPEILNFIHRMETHRPMILVDSVGLAAPKPKSPQSSGKPDKDGKSGDKKPEKKSVEKTADPRMYFKLTIQIHCHVNEEEGGA